VFENDVASKYSLRLPQMEYTRFPRASGKPPRASTTGSYPAGVSYIPFAGLGFHSQQVALLFQFIQVNFLGA